MNTNTNAADNADATNGLPAPQARDRVGHTPDGGRTRPKRLSAKKTLFVACGGTLAALFLAAAFGFYFDADDDPNSEGQSAAAEQPTPDADAERDSLSRDVDDIVVDGSRGDDRIDGEAGNDELLGSDVSDDLLAGRGEGGGLVLDPGPTPVVEPYVQELCVNVQHQPVPGQPSASGIWVNGSVYGLSSDTWIWIEGPTINGGQPVQIPVQPDGTFLGGLGINQYGDHEITRFGLWDGLPGSDPNDLLPGVVDQFGQPRIPVGPGEGPAFDQECFRIDPPTPAAPAAAGESAEAPGEDPVLMDQAVAFIAGFVTDHRAGDVDHLVQTLHPAIPMAFGDDTCTQYVERTVGSITDATVLGASGPGTFELDTPGGPIGFPEVIDVEVEMTLADGTTQVSDVHLPFHDSTPYWLTTCGWDVP